MNKMVDIAAYAYVLQTNVRIFFEMGYVDLYILYDEEQEHNITGCAVGGTCIWLNVFGSMNASGHVGDGQQ